MYEVFEFADETVENGSTHLNYIHVTILCRTLFNATE